MTALIQQAATAYASRQARRREHPQPVSVVRSYITADHEIVLVGFDGNEIVRYGTRRREGRGGLKFIEPAR